MRYAKVPYLIWGTVGMLSSSLTKMPFRLRRARGHNLWGLFFRDNRFAITWEWSSADVWWYPQIRRMEIHGFDIYRAGWLLGAVGLAIRR